MTKDEALRLALEALENHCGNYKLDDAGCERWNKAVAAIKEALAQPEQEPVAYQEGMEVATRAANESWSLACKKMVEFEREACAVLAEKTICDTHIPTGINIYGTRAAKAIRARATT